jgi:hypothetical protein
MTPGFGPSERVHERGTGLRPVRLLRDSGGYSSATYRLQVPVYAPVDGVDVGKRMISEASAIALAQRPPRNSAPANRNITLTRGDIPPIPFVISLRSVQVGCPFERVQFTFYSLIRQVTAECSNSEDHGPTSNSTPHRLIPSGDTVGLIGPTS